MLGSAIASGTYRMCQQLYAEKLTYDQAADTTGVQREPFPDYCYSYLLQKYGLKKLAERHCMVLISSLKQCVNTWWLLG